MRRYGALTICVLATIPNPFFDLAGITAGILRFPVAWFLLCCWAGKTVKFLLIAFLGAQSFGVLEQFLH
jgi:membrane protein YqaA with SNARE-associated domain